MDVSGSSVSRQAAARSSRPMKANRSATYPSSARIGRRPAPARPFRSTNLRQPSIRTSRTSRNNVNSRPTRTLSAFVAVILFGAVQHLLGYALENETWRGPTIPVVVEIVPSSFTLQDGSLTYNAVVENAMALWNEQMADIQFTWTQALPDPQNNGHEQASVTHEQRDQ